MKIDEHKNNVNLAKAIHEIILDNCVCVSSTNRSSVDSLIICLFNKFDDMSEAEILKFFDHMQDTTKKFHNVYQIVDSINDFLGTSMVTVKQVKDSRINDVTGVNSFVVYDYCIRVCDKFIIVHDYGIDSEIEIVVN